MVLPAVMLPTMRMGRRIRRTSRSTQDGRPSSTRFCRRR